VLLRLVEGVCQNAVQLIQNRPNGILTEKPFEHVCATIPQTAPAPVEELDGGRAFRVSNRMPREINLLLEVHGAPPG